MSRPVHATKAGSGLYPTSAREKCRERPAADGAGAFVNLVGFVTGAPVVVPTPTVGCPGVVHRMRDDDEPKPKPQRAYAATPGVMSHMLKFAHAFRAEHGRLPTDDERAAERQRFRNGAGLHSPVYATARLRQMRSEAYLRRKARASK